MIHLFSASFACHPGRDALVSVQVKEKRGVVTLADDPRGQLDHDPSPPAAGEHTTCWRQSINHDEIEGNVIRQAGSDDR